MIVRWLVCSIVLYPVYLGLSLIIDHAIGDRMFMFQLMHGSKRELLTTIAADWGRALPWSLLVIGLWLGLVRWLRRSGGTPVLSTVLPALVLGGAASIGIELWVGLVLAAALVLFGPLLPRSGDPS